MEKVKISRCLGLTSFSSPVTCTFYIASRKGLIPNLTTQYETRRFTINIVVTFFFCPVTGGGNQHLKCVKMDKMPVYAVWLKCSSQLGMRLEHGLFSFGCANTEAAKVEED